MPTYTINGKRITTAQPLSETQIDEIAAELAPVATTGSMVERIPTGGMPPAPPAQPVPSASERFLQNAIAGAAAVPVLGAAARGLQLATRGTKAAPFTAEAARALLPQSGRALAAEGVIGAVAGGVGGEVGQQVAQKSGEAYRPLGELVGGAFAGLGTNALVRNLPEAVTPGLQRLLTGTQPANEVSDLLGSIKARQKLQTALDANPALAGDLQRAREIEEITGVRLPVQAAAKGDTTLTGLLASETSRGENAAFTALMAQQERQALEDVAKAQKALAAKPKSVDAYTELQAAKVRAENAKREVAFAKEQERRTKQLDALDERITTLSSEALPGAGGREEIGARLKNLLEAKEAAIRGEFKPLYTDLLEGAKAEGVILDSPQVATLYNWVKTSRSEDVFADFPALFAKINKMLAPQKQPVSGKFADKYPNLVKTQEGTYKPMNVDDIDSLKREINKSIGSTNDPDKRRRLMALKQQFDGSLDSLPESFITSYRDLDKAYAKRLGLPFSEAGVVSVDRARFVENTVPMLTEKPSAIRQVLAATDNNPETVKVIEDAFMFRLANTDGIVNKETMQVNPAALQAFVRKNKEALDQVPGLSDRLKAVAGDVRQLKEIKQNLIEQQKQAKIDTFENVWSKAYGTSGGFEGFVNSALKRPEELNKLISLAGNDKVLQEGLKSSILEIGLRTPNKTEFFKDNAATINTLFGKEHAQKVQALLEASERLAQNPLRAKINQRISQQTGLEEMTGSRPEQIASEIRNPVLGTFRTFGNILSRFVQNRSGKAESAEIQEFLANPRAVQDAADLIAELERKGGGLTDKAKALAKKLAKNTGSAALFGGLAPVVTGELGLSERTPVQTFEEEAQ